MRKIILIFTVIALMTSTCYAQKAQKIVVSKSCSKLYAFDSKGDTLCNFNCSVGMNYGDKQYEGDKRTPEGEFSISSIEDSRYWTFDFNDGHGQRAGAYGPFFIRLDTPGWRGIGIHGTCFPELIGTRSSRGCIRLSNENLLVLIDYIEVGTKVVIEED